MLDSLTFIVLVFHFSPIYLKKNNWNPFTTHGTWTKKTEKKKKKVQRELGGKKKEEEGEQRKLTCT